MLNELKDYYEGELQFLTDMGMVFAKRFRKVADRLGISEQGVRDPHAERIVQAVALLNARVRKKLDDDLPEMVESLLGVVYPHFLRPFPSTAVASFQVDRKRGDPTAKHTIPSGTCVTTSPVADAELTYRTCGDLTLWPLQIQNVVFMGRPFDRVDFDIPEAQSVLRIHLKTLNEAIPAAQLGIDRLRFFLNIPALPVAGQLYELFIENGVEVTISSPKRPREHIRLGRHAVVPGRRSDTEALVLDSPRGFTGYRILAEQFACPESFLFVELTGLEEKIPLSFGSEIVLSFFFDRENRTLSRTVTGTSVQLGAVPIVNLFPKTVTDVPFTERKAEFRVIPDAQQELALEIYSIEDVSGVTSNGDRVPIRPFYATPQGGAPGPHWHTSRRPVRARTTDDDTSGYDQWISISTSLSSEDSPQFDRLRISTTCFNRSLPNLLSEGGRLPDLKFADGNRSLDVSLLTRPTPTRRPNSREGALWDLVSHLSLNYLSIDPQDASVPEAFRGLIQLYESGDEPTTHSLARGVLSVQCRPDVAILPEVMGGFCRGIEVTLVLDDDVFSGNSPYLFATALREFLSRYVGVNSFTRLVAMTKSMKDKKQQWKWAPKSGTRHLL